MSNGLLAHEARVATRAKLVWCGLRTHHKRRARYASGVGARRTERCGTHALRERGGGGVVCVSLFV